VIVTLLFLVRQTKFLSEALKASLFAPLDARQFDILKIFIDAPDLRPYFYDGAPTPPRDSSEYARVMAVAEYILDFFAAILIQRKMYGKIVAGDWWQAYMIDSFANSPALRELLDSRETWYRKPLHDVRKGAVQKRNGEKLGNDV
jgi:hypothetical protein